VGFVLAVLCLNLSYFLGHPYISVGGPRLNTMPIPVLSQIPVLGPLFFTQDLMTYASFIIIFLVWFWIYKTRPGLMLRGIGERPAAAYVRGANVNRLRYIYTVIGGAVAGLAGPAFSLSVKAGWAGSLSGLDGYGWIALSITIFGGWSPFRAAFGVYLFSLLQWLSLVLQPVLPSIPTQVLQVAPFPLMILTLLLVNISDAEWVERTLAAMPERTRRLVIKLLRALRASPPSSLGVPFENE
jgi:simple sugar transport system permease protein